MARARGGSSGSAWALVIFGALFFVSLLLAIVFFTQVKGAQEGQKNAEDRLAEFARPNEQSLPEMDSLRAEGGSVVGGLMDERAWLRTTVANDPDKSKEEIQASLASLGLEGVSLLQEVTRLQNELAGSIEMRQTLDEELTDARDRAVAAEQAKSDLDQGYQDSLASLQATLDQTTQALEATRQKIQEQKSMLDGEMAGTRQAYVDQIAAFEQQLTDKESEIAKLRKELFEWGGKAGQDKGPGNLTRVDGRIVSMGSGPNEVYISLGRDDRVQRGMTFEIFDSDELVKLTGYNNLRGKATIEVVDVNDAASLARIVRSERGRGVAEGDAIVNLVYDPQATYKFFVYGDFDFDDGTTGLDGQDRIVSRIRQWGGEVSDALTYDVDYLVLGKEPPLPTPPAEGEVDPTAIANYVAAKREYETYQQLIGEARSESLNIPILNQNRFLALVGEYDR